MENNQEKSQEEMVKEAVEEAKKSAGELPEGEPGEDQAEEENAKEASEDEEVSDNEEEEPDEEQEPDEEEEPDEEDEDKKSGKKLFGKKNKKDKKDEKIEELTDRLTRQMAEFDNFRKRTEKEKSQMYEIGAKDIIEKMLPVVDNFERGLDAVKEEEMCIRDRFSSMACCFCSTCWVICSPAIL